MNLLFHKKNIKNQKKIIFTFDKVNYTLIEEKTAGDTSFLFKQWIIPISIQDEFIINKICELANQKKIDFVLKEKNSEINFIHATYVENKNSILEKGLIISDNDWIPDLGVGIYVIEKDNDEALDNLKNYLENHEDEKICIINGLYYGIYYECIQGFEHEGYISIPNNIKPDILDSDIVLVSDFLYS